MKIVGMASPMDPVRNPKIQRKIEKTFEDNYGKTLKVAQIAIAKVLSNGKK